MTAFQMELFLLYCPSRLRIVDGRPSHSWKPAGEMAHREGVLLIGEHAHNNGQRQKLLLCIWRAFFSLSLTHTHYAPAGCSGLWYFGFRFYNSRSLPQTFRIKLICRHHEQQVLPPSDCKTKEKKNTRARPFTYATRETNMHASIDPSLRPP